MIFENKRILVTGGTGSMGTTLVKRILTGKEGKPAKVIVFSRDEAKQDEMRKRLLRPELVQFRLGDVRDFASVRSVVDADIVINAAALKQVPSCEYEPVQALLTNCMGMVNIIRAVSEFKWPVNSVIGISTDKAVKPVNVMGMTKALQERIIGAANLRCPDTRFLCVRYGNVLASRGSVIPLFHEQIMAGGPVTITVPEMTRFLLTLDQAVDTVIAALKYGRPGDTFIPKVPSATVLNIAKAMVGDRKIEIKEVGIRPGEKIHEILVSEEEAPRTGTQPTFPYYVIQSVLPELQVDALRKGPTKEYSSADVVLSLEETIELIKRHEGWALL